MIEPILALLNRDMLRNVVPLKMMAAYPEAVRCQAEGSAVLVLLPVRVSSFDRQMYPKIDTVAMLSGEDPQELDRLVEHLPSGGSLVFKLNHPNQREAVRRAFPLRRETAFLTFTSQQGSLFFSHPGLSPDQQPDEACMELYAARGYDREEVAGMFSHANARQFAIYKRGRPVCACLAWRNYSSVYEIGALYTRPEWRRKGYARQVVLAALDWVTGSGYLPRYQVNEQNEPSRRLAEAVGLVQFLTTEHWVVQEK